MWCAQTLMLTKPMQTVAATMTGYPKIGFRENTGMISDMNAKQGMIRMYTSGWPKIQKKCIHSTAEPPACVSKKWEPRYRSSVSMICAAVNGLTATNTNPDITRYNQTSSGSRLIFMPLQRMQMIVVTMFKAVPIDPTPLRKIDSVQ